MLGFNTPSTTIAPVIAVGLAPPVLLSLVIDNELNNNCARFNNSRSPKSPICALDTLGASLIKKAVTLSTLALKPVAA